MRKQPNRSLVLPTLLLVLVSAIALRAATAATTSYVITPGGPPVTVTIAAAGEDALVPFTGAAGQRVSLKMSNVTIGPSSCCSTKVSIRRPDGTNLVAPTNVGTLGGFIDTKTLTVAGAYTIFVDPQGTATGNITLTLYDVPADVSRPIVPGGAAVAVTTTTPGQNANATFPGTAGQRVSLKIGPACCSTKVSILKPDGTSLVAPTSFATAGGFIDTKVLTVAGTYTIFVDPQAAVIGSVTLTLYNVPADPSAPIAPGGPAVAVTTTTPGQNANATFPGAAGQRVSLKIGPACCSTKVSIQRPDGTNLVAPTSFATSGGFIDTKTLTVAGTYTIFVDPQAAVVGSVTLTLYDVPADPSTPIVPGGPAVTAATTTPGQNAKLTFDGTAGQRVSIGMAGVTISKSTVSILKPDGTTLVSMANVGTSGGFVDTKTLPVAGAYTILVDPQGTATGWMTLTLYNVPPDATATTTPGGAAVSVATTTAGQNATVAFVGAAGQRVSLKMSSVTIGPSTCCSTKVSIQKPDGTNLVAPTNVGTLGGFIDTKSLPVAGTYTIFVDPQGTAKGGMTLTLYDVPADVTATTTAGGPPVAVTTTMPGQNGRVTFDGVAGRAVSLRVAWAPTICCLVKISILRPDGTTLVAPLSVGATGAFIDAKMLSSSGTYTIFVDPQDSAVGSATLTLYDVPPDLTAPIVPGGPAVTLTTTTVGQNARFTFSAAAGDAAFVTVGPNCCPTTVSILKPDGTAVATPIGFDVAGGTLTARLPVAGGYTILVDLQGQSVGSVTVRLVIDNLPPATPVLTISEATTDSFASGASFYYRPAGAGGTFTVNAATSDGGSGVQKVDFPGLSGGFTPTALVSDSTSPYSQIYTWVAAATFSGTSNRVTVYDRVGNKSSATFAVVADSIAPTTTDDTGSIGSGWKNTTQIVTLAPVDAASGVAATHYTTNGSTPTTGSPQGTVITLSADGVYTIKYFSVDNVANSESVKTGSAQIRIDKTSPSSTITFPANGASYSSAGWSAGCATAGFCGTATDALSGLQRVEISMRQGSGNYWDGSSFASASEVFLVASGTATWSRPFAAASFPADGSYTIRVRAVDNAANVQTPVSRTFTYDTVAPDTTITAQPPNPSNQTSAGFSFTSTEAGSSFQCSLDGAAFSACTSPRNYTGLAAGAHTFQVRAIDPAGNTDPSPASYAWTVDTTAPNTTITAQPLNPTNQTSASFSFTSTEAGSSFQCSLDGAAFSACTSPRNYTGLAAGAHTFQVRATDPAGNVDASPAIYTWTVDTTAPNTTITAQPPNPSNQTSASFSFTSTEAGSSFECSLDGAGFSACTSPSSYTGLADGAHSFQVRATDPAGNTDASPASYGWTVDTTVPGAPVLSQPLDGSFNTSGIVTVAGTAEPGSSVEVFDGATSKGVTVADGAGSWTRTLSGVADGSHTYTAKATDAAGNTSTASNARTVTVDTIAPNTTITAQPPNPTNQTSAGFSFTSTETGSTFQCRLDGAAFAACTSPQNYAGLVAGSHVFEVRATDPAGNTDATSAAYTWTVDTTAPNTTITAQPPNLTNQTNASFSFTSTEAGSSFDCSLDGAALAACTSPRSYTGLADGAHTFDVQATDPAGNTDASPASYGWTVDTTAPAAPVLSEPLDGSFNTSGIVTVVGTAMPGSSIEVFDGASSKGLTAADGAGSWTKTLSAVADGSHTYTAKATDAAGNTSTASNARNVTVDTIAPNTMITSAPPNPTSDPAASFGFSASEGGSSFECNLDGAGFGACTSPQDYTGLADGAHTFAVRATDPAGNTDASPASYAWTVDTTAPDTTITAQPPNPSNETSASFSFTSTEAGTFQCSLDGAAFAGCTSPQDYTGLADGAHTFAVRATDAAGNTDASPAGYAWTVDTAAPATSITSNPLDPTSDPAASFGFSSTEGGSSFECSLDGAAFAACTSPQDYTGLADGAHTFDVQATDPAGNTDASPASYAWTVDTAAPDTSITSNPLDPTSDPAASFGFSSTEGGSSFECSLDGAAFGACTSPQDYTGLAPGSHLFEVRATDPAGNADGSPAGYTWTVV